jgi:hypothetical protein
MKFRDNVVSENSLEVGKIYYVTAVNRKYRNEWFSGKVIFSSRVFEHNYGIVSTANRLYEKLLNREVCFNKSFKWLKI